MSTRANIGIKKQNGEIEVIYSHSDGYPEYLGNVLNSYYSRTQAVKMILDLGDCSFLQPSLQLSRFYNSWRDEGTHKRVYKNYEELEEKMSGDIEFVYLWKEDEEKWIFAPITFREIFDEEGNYKDYELEFDWYDLDAYLKENNLIDEIKDDVELSNYYR